MGNRAELCQLLRQYTLPGEIAKVAADYNRLKSTDVVYEGSPSSVNK